MAERYIDDDVFSWADEEEADEELDTLQRKLYRIFAQNADGEEVLRWWLERYVMSLRVDMNPSKYKIGYFDGQAEFVKRIAEAINRVEAEDYE